MIISNENEMKLIGQKIGAALRGGECIELIGDVGAGKTTLTKGIATGLQIDEDVQSPSFTISRVYEARDGLSLQHYDFYRLSEPGVMSYELQESLQDTHAVTVIEWAATVADVLPVEHVKIQLLYTANETARELHISSTDKYDYITEAV